MFILAVMVSHFVMALVSDADGQNYSAPSFMRVCLARLLESREAGIRAHIEKMETSVQHGQSPSNVVDVQSHEEDGDAVAKMLDENVDERKHSAVSWEKTWPGGALICPLVPGWRHNTLGASAVHASRRGHVSRFVLQPGTCS